MVCACVCVYVRVHVVDKMTANPVTSCHLAHDIEDAVLSKTFELYWFVSVCQKNYLVTVIPKFHLTLFKTFGNFKVEKKNKIKCFFSCHFHFLRK